MKKKHKRANQHIGQKVVFTKIKRKKEKHLPIVAMGATEELEMQDLNEELESLKEDADIINQELITINLELQKRSEQLAEAYEYSEAVFETIRESIVILDSNLRIKNANRSFYKTFN